MIEALRCIDLFVFTPLLLVGGLGLLLAVGVGLKSGRRGWVLPAAATIFAVVWRVALGINSARYAALLLVAAVLYAGYFFTSRHVPALLRIVIAAVLAALMLGKNLHFNPYDDFHQRACRAVLAETGGSGENARFFTIGTDGARLGYYLNWRPVGTLDFEEPADLPGFLGRTFANLRRFDVGPCFLFLKEPSSRPLLTAADLGLPEGAWRCVGRYFRNRRRSEVLSVYRCDFVASGGETYPSDACFAPPKDGKAGLIADPPLDAEQLRHLEASRYALPENWALHGESLRGGALRVKFDDATLTVEPPRQGRVRLVTGFPVAGKAVSRLIFPVSAEPGAELEILLRSQNGSGQFSVGERTVLIFSDTRCHFVEIPIEKTENAGIVLLRTDWFFRKGAFRVGAPVVI